MDLVSIIIPFYNSKPNLLLRAVKSAFAQSYKQIQVVVCIDGSFFDENLLGEFINSSKYDFKLIKHSDNLGISAARNTAVAISDGKWLTWLDADDTLDEFCVENLIAHSYAKVMVLGNCFVYEGNCLYVRNIGKYYELAKRSWKTIDDPFLHNITAIQPELVSKEAFMTVNGFNTEYLYAEMTDFFLRLLSEYGIDFVAHTETAIYNYYRETQSHSQKNRKLLFDYRIRALQEYAGRMKYNVSNIEYDDRNDDGMQHYIVY